MTQRLTDPMQLKAPKRQRLTSVTTLIDQILPKPALVPWAERETAEGMLTLLRAGELHPSLTAHEALAAMREAKIGAEGVRTTAARRGVDVHALLERYARDGSWADPVGLLDVDDYPYAHALNDWLRKYRPEPHEIEQLVADPEHGYAGRLDLIATIDGQRTLVDLKSQERAGIYSAAHIQARAYERASVRCDGEPVDRVLIVVVAKDGTYREMDCLMTSRGFESALKYYRALKPVESACDSANRIEREARAEPKPEKPEPPEWESAPDHPDPARRPGEWKDYRRRELPDGSIIEFESAPAGYTTRDGKRRQREWRAYWLTPPMPEALRAAA
jgi:hypothetical protein